MWSRRWTQKESLEASERAFSNDSSKFVSIEHGYCDDSIEDFDRLAGVSTLQPGNNEHPCAGENLPKVVNPCPQLTLEAGATQACRVILALSHWNYCRWANMEMRWTQMNQVGQRTMASLAQNVDPR